MNLMDDPELRTLYEEQQKARANVVAKLRELRAPVKENFSFSDIDTDKIFFKDLFGDQRDLFVIHNMGRSCRWCTLWADGLNGLLEHLESRASVVLVSGDAPDVQQEFAEGRGWNFRMLQDTDGSFTDAMEFAAEHEGQRHLMPGVSTFHKEDDGTITHVASDMFGPGDVYMPVYPLMELLDDPKADWEPQYSYQKPLNIDVPPSNGN